MTSAARRFLVNDMETMASVLALGVGGMKALVVQNAGSVVAFIAKGVLQRVLCVSVSQDKLPFEQRNVNRAMRAVGTCTAGVWSLVIVMTIRAINAAGDGQGGKK